MRDSLTNEFQFTAFLKFEFHCRLDIIFDFKSELHQFAILLCKYENKTKNIA